MNDSSESQADTSEPERLPDIRSVPSLDLRQLHYLVTLADEGSISAAAATLNMAQPSLSESMMRLERKLEVKLFARDMRGVQLTEAGRTMIRYSRQILGLVAHATTEIRQWDVAPKGGVSIGLPPSLSLLLSVPLAETVHTDYPDIRLHIREALSGDVLSWIEAERLDFGCVYELPDRDLFVSEALLEERLFLITAADNWPSHTASRDGLPTVTGSELQHLPLVLPSASHGSRKLVERFARAAGISLNVVLEIDSLSQIVNMVRRASGYMIAPHAAVVEYVASGELVLVDMVEPDMRRTAYVCRKRARSIGQASAKVQTLMIMILREMIERYHLRGVTPSGSIPPLP